MMSHLNISIYFIGLLLVLTEGFTLFADNAGVIVNPKGEMKGKLN